MKLDKFKVSTIISQIPLVAACLGYYLVPNLYIDWLALIIFIVWSLILLSYNVGAKFFRNLIYQTSLLVAAVIIYFIPGISVKPLVKDIYLQDDFSNIQIRMYNDNTFKSTCNVVFGFYENWKGNYKIVEDTIFFDSPYYDAGGPNLRLYKTNRKGRWVREVEDINRNLQSFEYFTEKFIPYQVKSKDE